MIEYSLGPTLLFDLPNAARAMGLTAGAMKRLLTDGRSLNAIVQAWFSSQPGWGLVPDKGGGSFLQRDWTAELWRLRVVTNEWNVFPSSGKGIGREPTDNLIRAELDQLAGFIAIFADDVTQGRAQTFEIKKAVVVKMKEDYLLDGFWRCDGIVLRKLLQ